MPIGIGPAALGNVGKMTTNICVSSLLTTVLKAGERTEVLCLKSL